MLGTQLRLLKIPKDHLLSILADPTFGSANAHAVTTSLIDPHTGEVSLLFGSRDSARPILIVVPATEQRDVLARVGNFGKELAPLSQWLRVVTPDWARRLVEGPVSPTVDDLTPAWVGAIIGEVLARESTKPSDVSMNWIYSSATFSIARCKILWPGIRSNDRVADDVQEARLLMRADSLQVPSGLVRICGYLSDLHFSSSVSNTKKVGDNGIRRALGDLQNTSTLSPDTVERLADEVPDLKELSIIDSIGPEDRVRLFDQLIGVLREKGNRQSPIGRECLQFGIGYVVGRIGAGEANLDLLDEVRIDHPETMVWAAMLPALYRPFFWGKAFDGLGRLVLRELVKPLHPEDMPSVDISLDELRATMNPKVDYKRLPFRTAQKGIAAIEIVPGVVHTIGLHRSPPTEITPSHRETQSRLDFERNQYVSRFEFQSLISDLLAALEGQGSRRERPEQGSTSATRGRKPSSRR